MSSLKRGSSEDHPPTPPPRSGLNRPSVSESNHDADESILVETHEIQAQIEALKKGGLLPQHSYSQMEEGPPSPRRRPLRGTKSGGKLSSCTFAAVKMLCSVLSWLSGIVAEVPSWVAH